MSDDSTAARTVVVEVRRTERRNEYGRQACELVIGGEVASTMWMSDEDTDATVARALIGRWINYG